MSLWSSVWWLFTVLLVVLSFEGLLTKGEAWSSSLPRGQQILPNSQGGGLLMAFPEGRVDGTLFKTDYQCAGENMTVSCIDSDGPGLHGTIQVVRANFGRFSIAICNQHGQTDWSVNCMDPQSTKVLQRRCDNTKKCVVPVNSDLFHDACPGTHKYLEIHYACLSTSAPTSNNQKPNSRTPWKPSWMSHRPKEHHNIGSNNGGPNSASEANNNSPSVNTIINVNKNLDKNNNNQSDTNSIRKPILVTEKVVVTDRVPITTPRPTTEAPTTTATSTTTASTMKARSSTTPRGPLVNEVVEPKTPIGGYPDPYSMKPPINTPSTSTMGQDVYVTPMTGAPACQPTTARQLQWNWTPAGQVSLQPCPLGTTGLARWYCAENSEFTHGGQWQGKTPDMSDCKSLSIAQLEAQVRQEDPENVLVSNLAYQTRSKGLYGGDLEVVINVMRTVASRIQYRLQSSSSFHDKVNHIRQVLLNVLRSAANILEDGPNREAWNDLSPDRQMKLATSLMLALEENAFLLAGVSGFPQEVLETYESLTMTIKVLSVGGYDAIVTFPSKPLLYVDDKISLATSDLEDNSQGGLAKAVFFSYRGLHEILSKAKTHLSFGDSGATPTISNAAAEVQQQQPSSGSRPNPNEIQGQHWRLNSRIISASLGQGRHIELQDPVTITLRHLVTDPNILKDPVCVFWDYEVHGWSDSGCHLVDTNQTFSVCQCDHLTNFALLMRPVKTSTFITNVRLDIVAYVVSAVVFLSLLILIFKMRSRLKSWCQSTTTTSSGGCCLASCCSGLFRNDKERGIRHLDSRQSFYTGLSQGGPGGSIGSTPGCGYPQLTNTAKKSRTLGGPNGLLTSGLSGNNFANTTSRVPLQYTTDNRMQNSTPLMLMTKPRAHITLNPYSTQLVDNLNMMMPGSNQNSNNNSTSNSSASTNSTCLTPLTHNISPQLMNLTNTLRRPVVGAGGHNPHPMMPAHAGMQTDCNGEVVYRAVSPHGHVYWEIDPNNMYGTTNNNHHQILNNEENMSLLSQQQQQNAHISNNPGPVSRPYLTSRHGQLTEEDLLLQQHLLASDQTTNGLHDAANGLQHVTHETSFQPGMVMMASSSNTAAGAVVTSSAAHTTQSFVRTGANRFTRKQTQQQAQPQQTVATVSQASNVPEQLQTQVQIRDIRPIQVSVKSSEYIEAKIRTTLRRNNHTNSDS